MNPFTSKELGLLKQCSYKKQTITSLSNDLEKMKLISSRTIGKLGGIDAVMKYRVELGGWEKAWLTTIIKPYTNKKGETFPAHFTQNNKYIGRVNQGIGSKGYLGFCEVNKDTISKWEIVDLVNFTLSPIKLELRWYEPTNLGPQLPIILY
tara:strand:- start:2 stop:454 length:453 start_codon:yes stop_codon:yes gene_type:complete